MRLEPVSKNFNVQAAADYVEFAKAYPDEAEYIVRLMAAAEIERIMEEDGDAIVAKTFDDNYQMLKKSLARGIANGTMSSDAVDATIEAVEIAKAYSSNYNRPWVEQDVKRDKGGRFSTVDYAGAPAASSARVKNKQGGKGKGKKYKTGDYAGLPSLKSFKTPQGQPPNGRVSEKFAGQYLEAAQQLGAVLNDLPQGQTPGKLTITPSQGETKEVTISDRQMQRLQNASTEDRTRIANEMADGILSQHASMFEGDDNNVINNFEFANSVGDGPTLSIGGNDIDLSDAKKAGLIGKDPLTEDRKYSSGTSRNAARVGRAGAFLEDSGGAKALDAAGVNGTAIAQGAQFVGDFGPTADKVMGPGVRRAFYRYQGKEKKPEKALQKTIQADTRGLVDREDARDAIFVPRMETKVTASGYEDVPVPSNTMRFWQKRLPSVELLSLHTSSGATPPSEGMIIDKKGKVVAMSVGSHDDHYLPFNLKRMNRARGGEYVRTRSMGGLTSEDIDGGIIGGTKAVTVVSHSGIFTMEFSPSGKGALSKARRVKMRKRYEQLVDSLASKKVNVGDVPKDRKDEIQATVEAQMPGTTQGVIRQRKARIRQMVEQERKSPTPSEERKAEWTEEFLMVQGDKFSDRSGAELGPEAIRAEAAASARRKDRTIRNDQDVISELGVQKEYEKFMRQKTNEYSSSLGPLRTNGQGYYKAMQALKEQFPYDIAEVRWTPPDATSVGAGGDDPGYVKPKHLRSDKVLTGYWDSEVEGQVNPGARRERNLKGTGKRRASTDNYANAFARERLENEGYYDKGGEEPPKGEGGSAATAGGGSYADSYGDDDFDVLDTEVSVTSGKFGPKYSGFRQMENPKSVQLTPYQEVNQLMKVRRHLKSVGPIEYEQALSGGGRTKAVFDPWDTGSSSNEAANTKYPSLFMTGSDSNFQARLQNDDDFRNQVMVELTDLYNAGQQGEKGFQTALARSVDNKNLFDGLVTADGGKVGSPKNPTNALALVNSLQEGKPSSYDFSQGMLDGSLYLPGLAQREHRAAWHADSDIETFANTAERRFGVEINDKTDPRTVRRMSVKFGNAMREGLDQAADWKQKIEAAGGPDKVSDTQLVKYGGETYSIYSARELEDQIARDALAMAKIKQLRQVIRESGEKEYEENEPMKEISIEDLREMKREDGTRDPRLVGSLKTPQRGINQKKLKSAQENMDKLVGLSDVKGELDTLISDAKVSAKRKEAGLQAKNKTMHLVFTGNPGTGKTTVANELARAYNALGLIPSDKVVVASRADLVGQYAGHTASKTRRKFNEAKGGVLFIDEAYALVNSDDDAFGFEAVDELVAQSENNRDNTVVIMAGYKNDMNRLMGANPGLKSRFPKTIDFPDYNAGDLGEIQARGIKESDYAYQGNAASKMEAVARKMVDMPDYSNARDARNFREMMFSAQAQRVNRDFGENATRDQLITIKPEDVDAAEKMYFKQRTGGVK